MSGLTSPSAVAHEASVAAYGRVSSVNSVQPLNTHLSIVVTLAGTVSDVKPVQFAKA